MATPGTTIYGGSPHAQGQLAEHLAWLAESLRRVNLHGLAPEGCADSALDLASIAVPLATDRRVEIIRSAGLRNSRYFDEDVHPDELKLDMTGNVYQWTASAWQSYPGAPQPFADAGERVVRGSAYGGGQRWARVTHRIKSLISKDHSPWGFRIVVAPAENTT